MSGDDPRLQNSFDRLKREHLEHTPGFERIRDAALARRPGGLHRARRWMPRIGFAVAAVAVAAVVWTLPPTPSRLDTEELRSLGSWRTASDALLEIPSLSGWKRTPRFEPKGYLEMPEPARSEHPRKRRFHA